MKRTVLVVVALGSAHVACRTTKPGTHVELVDQDGAKTYVAGAAGPGMNQGAACGTAVNRAVAAIALRFAQENDDVADEVAEAVGVDDGEVFLQRYAKAAALDAAVQDIKFDPIDHLCMATVRWKPPIFVKDAVLQYAERLKAAEAAAARPQEQPAAAPTQASTAPAPSTPPPAAQPVAPPPPVSVAPPAPAPAAPPAPAVPACKGERRKLTSVLSASQSALDDLNECRRRTQNDDTICHRYKLKLDEAAAKEAGAGEALCACLNGGLSVTLRGALTAALPGHAAVPVETRADGALVLWTFSPVDKTAFAIDVSPDGNVTGRTPLAANQVQWVRQQLGL